MTHGSVMAQARRLERAGDPLAALMLLGDLLRQDACGPEELQSAGRLAGRLLQSPNCDQPHQKLLVLGQCTTTWLTYTLMAVALRRGLPCIVSDGPYDNVLQTLDELAASDVPDVLVLLPWHQRLLSEDQDDHERHFDQELAFWQRAWRIAAERGVKRLIQVAYDWTVPGARGFHLGSGYGGDIDVVRRINQALREALPSGGYFVPLEEISGTLGRQHFYDPRRQHWTRQPFSEVGLQVLSEHVVAGLRALTTGPRKVLILDLDNTLWGGIVGETGALGIELGDSPLGEAFRSFQQHLRALARRGVLLAVCSKNNEDDAREPFLQNPDMVLKLDDFVHFIANWEPKTEGIRRIADELRLGLESFVFFDDNPFERDMVRQTLPQVEVVDVPDDPSSYVNVLQAGLWFESCGLTVEDWQRTELYAAETRRRAAEMATGSMSEYLASLFMQGKLSTIDERDMQRVVQLLAKTNQFNLTTRRHTANDVRRLLSVPGCLCLSVRVTDRFADHGLVALALCVPDPALGNSTLLIDSFLMSCRVIGRTVEAFLLRALLRRATEYGYKRVVGEFVPSAKNQIVAAFFEQMGFTPATASVRGGACFELSLPAPVTMQTFVADQG